MNTFFNQIQKLDNVEEFKLRDSDDRNVYSFNYRGLTLSAVQIVKNEITLSRMNFSLLCEDLLVRVSKEKILEKINQFNKKVITLKIILQKIEENDAYFRFTVEYGISDEIFQYIELEDNLKLLFATPKVFINSLLNEDENNE
ncbi:hypothetical protein DCO44_07525 [Acinetobacter sp. AM]|jgi:hypothetical protein|uniref:hypothetical protein n=1 Tax=Acinetobacter sp. AM TaxID=2170730 RepID=UPI000DE6C1C7|nr:hypothetical protein [Acinetobacter sp. AM]PWB14883.1 hypothetical protein DCO44_07525 [Acinetobacter sp. AM]